MRDSMVIYRSFFDAVKSLGNEDQAKLWQAIMEYGLNFNELEMEGVSATIFNLIKPQLDANLRRYENGMKPKLKLKQKRSKAKANENENENENGNENVNRKPDFVPPSKDEVIDFFVSNGYKAEIGLQCFQYYQDGNWKDSSGKKIISWKQKVRGVWFTEKAKINPASSGFGYSRGSTYNPAGS